MKRATGFRRKVLALAVLAAFYAGGDSSAADIVLKAFYPVPYGEYQNLMVRTNFTVGSQAPLMTGLPATSLVASTSEIHGNATINGTLSMTNSALRLNAGFGPYDKEALRVSAGFTGATKKVMVGTDDGENRNDHLNTEPRLRVGTARFKVHTVIAGRNLYALDYVTSPGPILIPPITGTPNHVVGGMRGFTDTTRTMTAEQKKAQFYSKYDNGTATTFTDDTLFAPLRIDGHYVRLGEKIADRDYLGGTPILLGKMETVMIGTQLPHYKNSQSDAWQPQLFLQVGNENSTSGVATGDFQYFSSRAMKKDIAPFSAADYSTALEKVVRTPLYRYRMKGDAPDARLELGVIAEDTPAEMTSEEGKAVNTMSAYGYLTAAVKELKVKNEALKKRLESLEKQYQALPGDAE